MGERTNSSGIVKGLWSLEVEEPAGSRRDERTEQEMVGSIMMVWWKSLCSHHSDTRSSSGSF